MRVVLSKVLLLLVSYTVFQASQCIGQDYKVVGELCWETFSVNGAVIRSNQATFEVVVQDCYWQMRIVPISDSSPETAYDYHELSFDGTNIYHVGSIGRNVEKRRKAGEQVGKNVAVAGVYRMSVPHIPTCHEAGPIWLAYASQCFFSSAQTNVIEPVGPLNIVSGRHYEETASMTVAANVEIGDSGLPKRVDYFDDGTRKIVDPFGKVYVSGNLPSTYSTGYTNTSYEVLEWASFQGGSFPKRADFKTFWISSSTTDVWKTFLLHRYKVSCEKVFVSEARLVLPPKLPGITLVNDVRFLHAKPSLRSCIYEGSERFLTEQEVLASDAYSSALKGQIQAPSQPLKVAGANVESMQIQRIFLGMIFVGSIAFLLFLLVRNRRTNTHEN